MDELLQNLSQATNPEPTIQANLAQYINLQIQNPEFGNLLFLILQDEYPDIPPHILSICCNLLKLWARVQWEQMDYDKRCFFFDSLKKLIMKDHRVINDLSNVFIDIANHSLANHNDIIESTRYYESHIYDFFNRISAGPPIHYLHALTDIIYFISRRYKHSTSSNEGSEPTLLFTRICNVFIPLFHNEELITTAEGSEILFKSLSIFKAFFFHIYIQKVNHSKNSNFMTPSLTAKKLMEKAVIPINFAQNVLIAFSKRNLLDLRLVAHCCRFLNSFYKLTIFNKNFHVIALENNNFESIFTKIENILQVNLSVLSYALEVASSDTFLIPSILRVFETFRKYLPPEIGMLNIILTASQLTTVDQDEFLNSPNIFYLNVYEKFKDSDSNAVPQISKSIIYSMIEKNHQLFMYLLSLPLNQENVIRCIGYCLPLMKKLEGNDYENVLNSMNQYYVNLLQASFNDPILIAARLYFLYRFVPFLPEEQRIKLMENVVCHYFGLFLNQANVNQSNENSSSNNNNLNGLIIITLNTCKLFKRLLKYDVQPFSFEGSLQTLVTFHSYCFTPIVIDLIKIMVSKEREKIIPFAESILEKVFISFNISFSQYLDSSGDSNQIEAASDSIESNLNLCSMLIESSIVTNDNSSVLIKPFFASIIQVIFENGITECCDEFVHLFSVIFSTSSELIPQLIDLWFSFSLSKDWIGFIDQLIEPFFGLISKSPHLFIQLEITEKIEEVCLSFLIETSKLKNSNSVYRFASLIAWICLIDPSFDAAPELQCVQLICDGFCNSQNFNDFDIVVILSLFDVMAALTVSRKVIPPQPILLTMLNIAVGQNWILKIDQKRLYSIFILTTIFLLKNESNQNDQFFTSALSSAFDLLNEELAQRSLGNEDYFDALERSFPDQLAFLTEDDVAFQSPQEKINVGQMLAQAVSMFNQDFIESLRNSFPNVFATFL
ncbi:hypothetical protein M9Y10_009584 [Tritrichomonas musculus]|uniref:Importin N-terminal domain-containing protein n=1 Tax=Tritrichomonas musculus TaxID=1915356 RepID=A0ABR2IQJ1_9EUKA